MDGTHFDDLLRQFTQSRRSLFGGALATLTGTLAAAGVDAKKKRKKKHKKKRGKRHAESTCGKAGSKPVKGTCCAGSVLVAGVCRRCDVCKSGCQFSAIQAAIDAASAGATISICPGIYRENLRIEQDVRLVGAGAGEDAGDTFVEGTGLASVVTIETNGLVTLERLRLSGGFSSYGGGIYNNDAVLTLSDCMVSGNTVALYGAGIHNNGGEIRIDADSRVMNNTAGVDGGGIYNFSGTVTLASSAIVSGNTPNNCKAVANCNG